MEANYVRQEIKSLSELIEQQRKLVPVCGADDDFVNQTCDTLDKLDADIGQEIQILVTGDSYSGKTTLLSALFREEDLYFFPSSVIPVEFHYGTERRAIIYPRKGPWLGDDGPFQVTPSPGGSLDWWWDKKGSAESLDSAESLFEKAQIFISNPVLEQFATFIEVPEGALGANRFNYYKFQKYVANHFQKYVNHTDIVLYVIDAKHVSACARAALKWLREFLRPNLPILVVVTCCDRLSPRGKEIIADIMYKDALPYTADLGIEAIHFVSSWRALNAIETNDDVLWEKSGLKRLESYLANELCLKMNYAKINRIIKQIEQINVDLSAQIEMQYNVDVWDECRATREFQERSEELLSAQLQIELIKQKLNDLRHHCE